MCMSLFEHNNQHGRELAANVLSAISFLERLAVEDLKNNEFESLDGNDVLILAIGAAKPEHAK